MVSRELDQMLSDALAEVLESMFFTSVVGDSEPCEHSPEPWISAQLTFHGHAPGRFGVRVPWATGRKVAASFLGTEEDMLSEERVEEVICELANMLCGSVLSRLEKETHFVLSQPGIETPEAVHPTDATACRAFQLEEGPLAVWLELEPAA